MSAALGQSADEIAQRLLAGEIAAGARAIRWLDDRDPRGSALLSAIFAHTGRAQIVGVTGPPGAGKSTLTDMLVTQWRAGGKRVAVIAVDPSSPFTGGAILGDRVRMARHATDPGVFIRSLGTRGQAGGLSRSTHDAALVFDAMGYDIVLIETVGVGQDEIDVVNLAHTTLIVAVPGLGDEIQAVKAGIMEAGDIFVVNKADREGYEATRRQMELMLHLRANALPDRPPVPLLRASAAHGEGGAEIVDAIEAHRVMLVESGDFTHRAGLRLRDQVMGLVRDALAKRALEVAGAALLADVDGRRIDPHSAAARIVERLLQQGSVAA
jgi:LAO/AO transport system kinase